MELNEDDFNFDKNKNNIKSYNKEYPDIEKVIKSSYDLNKNDKNNINIPHKKTEEEGEHYFINSNNFNNNINNDSPKMPLPRISKVKKIVRNKNRNSHKNNFLFNSVGLSNNNNYFITSIACSTQNNQKTSKIPIDNKKQENKLEISSSTKNIHKPNIDNIIENNDNFKDFTNINKDDKKSNINPNSKNYIKKISTPKQSSKKNNSLNTNNNTHIENNLNIQYTHLGSSLINHSLTKVNSQKKNTPLYEFLSQINLSKYFNNMDSNGFDDVSILITEAKKDALIKDQELKEVGISYPGERAKILIRLKEKANLFGFSLPKGVYHTCKDLNKINEDKYISELNKWLKTLKVEKYLMNFVNSGYHSLDLLLLQMNTENPLTSEILRDEIGIDIIGYRSRILNKLKDDGKYLYNKLKTTTLIVNNKDNDRKCDCFIL